MAAKGPIVLPPAKKPVEQKPPELPSPPDVASKTPPTATPATIEEPPQLPPWRAKAKPAKKVTRKQPAPPVQASQPVTAPAPEAVPEPQLAPMMTDAQRASLLAAVNDLVSRAERNLGGVENKATSDAQKEMIHQARTFIAQAQEIRGRDLAAARSLAERAEILSREVLSQMK